MLFPCFGIHIRVFFNTESLNKRATHFKDSTLGPSARLNVIGVTMLSTKLICALNFCKIFFFRGVKHMRNLVTSDCLRTSPCKIWNYLCWKQLDYAPNHECLLFAEQVAPEIMHIPIYINIRANEEQIMTGYRIDGAMGSSGGGHVWKLSVVCLHNNAIVARGILVTILHCGTHEYRLSTIYIVSSVGTSLMRTEQTMYNLLYKHWV